MKATDQCPTCLKQKDKRAKQCSECHHKFKPKGKDKTPKPCSYCNELYWPLRKGMCSKHYVKWKKYGDPGAGYEVEQAINPVGTIAYLLECSENHPGPLTSECRIWTKAIDAAGYGRYGASDGTVDYAHRLAYRLFVLPDIPEGMYICHHCDIRCCVNPNHLFLGEAQDNHDDMIQKNRAIHPLGTSKKFTKDDVILIRQRLFNGESAASLVQEYNVSATTIYKIKNNRTWKDI